jgi:hypothetical protein
MLKALAELGHVLSLEAIELERSKNIDVRL